MTKYSVRKLHEGLPQQSLRLHLDNVHRTTETEAAELSLL